jgi:hypothetical protein
VTQGDLAVSLAALLVPLTANLLRITTKKSVLNHSYTDQVYSIMLQKEHQNVEAPFYYLAQEFHKIYNEKLDLMKSLT